MKAPWTGKTGLAKLAAIFATSLGVSFGLCGANFGAVVLTGSISNSRIGTFFADTLVTTGSIEVIAMILSFVGLLITGVVWLLSDIWNFTHKRK